MARLEKEWRNDVRLSRCGRRLNSRLMLEYDLFLMTRSEFVSNDVRQPPGVISRFLELEDDDENGLLSSPRGMTSTIGYTYVVYVSQSVKNPIEFLSVLTHEASHVVDNIEIAARAKFCAEVRAYILEEVVSLLLDITQANWLMEVK